MLRKLRVFFSGIFNGIFQTLFGQNSNIGTAFFRNNLPYAFRRRVEKQGGFTGELAAWLGLASEGVGFEGGRYR